MKITLPPAICQFIERKLAQREYATAEDVLGAGIAALQQQEHVGDFEPHELDRLLSEGEQSIEEKGTIDAASVFAESRTHSAGRRRA